MANGETTKPEMDAVVKSISGLTKTIEGLTKVTEEQGKKLGLVEELTMKSALKYDELKTAVEAVSKTAGAPAKRVLFNGAGTRGPHRVRDKESGILYGSLGKAAIGVAEEFGLNPLDKFAWYKLPEEVRTGRFVPCSAEEIAQIEAKEQAAKEAVEAEANAKLAAEKAAADAAEAAKTPAA